VLFDQEGAMHTNMPYSQTITNRQAQSIEAELLQDLLKGLYAKQSIIEPDNGYLLEHGSSIYIENQVRTFHWYRPYLPNMGSILDWGCNHAPDSCLLRASFGDRLSLYSCDFIEANQYEVFHSFAHTNHKRLDDEIHLPFASNFFDAVIGSGVLEHTAMDDESLKELHRVVKPDGVLVISYLPNRLSFQEWVRRVIRKKNFHRRLYGLTEAKQLLKRRGFYPIVAGYHTFFWERKLAAVGLSRWERRLSKLLTRLLPLHLFGSTLYFVAQKVTVM
jgi:SAM-dependent methyltransferase